jgi:hypothetical protein
LDGSDDTGRRNHGHVWTYVSGTAIENNASNAKKLCDIGSDDLRRYGIARSPLFELEELAQFTVLRFRAFKLVNLLTEACILVGKAFVFFFYIDEIDVVGEEVRNSARTARDDEFNGGANLQERAIHTVQILGALDVCAEKEKRNSQKQDHEGHVSIALPGHGNSIATGLSRW